MSALGEVPGDAQEPMVRLLDYDPELGRDLREERRAEAARTALAPTLTLPRGSWDEEERNDVSGASAYGLLVLDGLLSRTVLLGGEDASTQLLGRGDLIRPDLDEADALVPVTVRWSVLEPATLAVLDDRFLLTVRRWPEIVAALFERVAAQAVRLGTHRALCQLPRVEDRLHALLWFLAERWGRMTPQGVVVPLRLTQELIGQLLGAKRPTVSLAIKELETRGSVHRRGDGAWLLEQRWSRGEVTAALAPVSAMLVQQEGLPAMRRRPQRWLAAAAAAEGDRYAAVPLAAEAPPSLVDIRQRIDRMRERHERSMSEANAIVARSIASRARSAAVRERVGASARPRR